MDNQQINRRNFLKLIGLSLVAFTPISQLFKLMLGKKSDRQKTSLKEAKYYSSDHLAG